MSNKVLLGVLVIIVAASMGVGVLIGMQLGGSEGEQAAATTPATEAETPTPIPTADEQGTESSGGEQTPEQTPIPAYEFNEREIRLAVTSMINDRRAEADLDAMRTDSRTAERLAALAQNHSDTMAEREVLNQTIDGRNSEARYKAADLFERCKISSPQNNYFIDATGNDLEVVGKTVAGRPYSDLGQTAFNENETQVAEALVDDWYDNPRLSSRLGYENAAHLGVGVAIADDGTVYATATVC